MYKCVNYKVGEDDLKALIFDCDGTLIDTMPAYWKSWERVTREYGLDFNEHRFYSMAGIPVKEIIQTLVNEALIVDKTLKFDVDEICAKKKKYGAEFVVSVGTPKIQCVVDIALQYHGKMPLAVASSGHREHVIHSLQSNGILELFDAVVTAEDIKNPKPAPDIFLEAARRLGVNPKECRGFEDGDAGMTSLIAAGMEAVDVRLMDDYPTVLPSEVSVLQLPIVRSRRNSRTIVKVVVDADAAHTEEAEKKGKKSGVFLSMGYLAVVMVPLAIGAMLLMRWFAVLLAEAISEDD